MTGTHWAPSSAVSGCFQCRAFGASVDGHRHCNSTCYNLASGWRLDCEHSSETSPLFYYQPGPYQGLSGPPGPKCRKCLPASGHGTPRKVRTVQKTLSRHFPETLRRLPRLCPGLSGDFLGFRRLRPRETFRDFLAFRARGLGTPKPLFMPMCVYRLTMYLVKPPSWDKGSGRYIVYLHCSPFKFLGTKGKGERYLPDTLSQEGAVPDTLSICKHTWA